VFAYPDSAVDFFYSHFY